MASMSSDDEDPFDAFERAVEGMASAVGPISVRPASVRPATIASASGGLPAGEPFGSEPAATGGVIAGETPFFDGPGLEDYEADALLVPDDGGYSQRAHEADTRLFDPLPGSSYADMRGAGRAAVTGASEAGDGSAYPHPEDSDDNRAGVLAELVGSLSEEQSAAALEFDAPVLMLAGAGSGKTRSLVGRIARLVAPVDQGGLGADPDSVMVVTFTNKAAREMKQRLKPVIAELERAGVVAPNARNPMWIGTFHGLSMHILRNHAKQAGFEHNFTVMDPGSEKQLAQEALMATGLWNDRKKDGDRPGEAQMAEEAFLGLVEQAKNQAISPEFLREEIAAFGGIDDHRLKAFEKPKVLDAYQYYQDSMRRDNSVDFADLLTAVITLFRENEPIARHWRSRIRHFMVDEFQDVNPAQMQWLNTFMQSGQAMAQEETDVMYEDRVARWPRPTIALAGDEDQTIYTFRGSDVSIIMGFEGYFPDGVVRKLETNYRCQPTVLAAANRLIGCNRDRRGKVLVADGGNPPKQEIRVARTGDDRAHAEEIVTEIAGRIGEGVEAREFAILSRTSSVLKEFEDAFKKHGVPYQVYGSADLSRREEIRDMMAYAELTANPEASMAFQRICNKPARGISSETVQKIKNKAIGLNISTVSAARMVGEGGLVIEGLRHRAVDAVADFFAMMNRIVERAADLPPRQALEMIAHESGYRDDLEKGRDKEGSKSAQKLYHLKSLGELAEGFWKDARADYEAMEWSEDEPKRTPLAEFHEKFMMEGRDAGREAPAGVAIMTMHAAKGLEFDRVYLPFFMARITPHQNAMGEEGGEEEERRLAYVAFTRARKELNILFPSTFPVWARGRQAVPGDNTESRFLREAFGVSFHNGPQPEQAAAGVVFEDRASLARPSAQAYRGARRERHVEKVDLAASFGFAMKPAMKPAMKTASQAGMRAGARVDPGPGLAGPIGNRDAKTMVDASAMGGVATLFDARDDEPEAEPEWRSPVKAGTSYGPAPAADDFTPPF